VRPYTPAQVRQQLIEVIEGAGLPLSLTTLNQVTAQSLVEALLEKQNISRGRGPNPDYSGMNINDNNRG